MKIKRKDIINRRLRDKKLTTQRKLVTTVNAGLLLLAGVAVVDQLANTNQVAFAENNSSRKTPEQFLNLISGYAKNLAAENDLYASVMIAQASLESAWGNSTLATEPNYNLFGIKGEYNGEAIEMKTLEDDGEGEYYEIVDKFRRYPSYHESLQDYVDVVTGANSNWRKDFYAGARFSNADDYTAATKHLTGRYATDTRYGDKLNSIIEKYNLTRYDMVKADDTVPYTVKSGDSLYRIAMNNGMTLDELKQLNGITTNTIHPNQTIKVKAPEELVAQNTSQSLSPIRVAETNEKVVETSTPRPTASTSKNVSIGTYKIKAGDSLYRIARNNGMTIAELKELNGLTSNLIHPNQTLKVKSTQATQTVSTPSRPATPTATATSTTSSRPTASTSNSVSTGTYKIKAGDSLYRIARNNGMTIAELKELNGLTSNLIHPNQTLKVKSTQATQTVSTPSRPATLATPTATATSTTSSRPTASTSNSVSTGTYKIKAGDSLYRIARNNGMTIAELKELNGLTSNLIHPNQTLKVKSTQITTSQARQEVSTPVSEPVASQPVVQESALVTQTATALTQEVTPEAPSASQTSYTVQAGDTLYSISRRYGLDINQMVEQNNGTLIRVGQTLNFE